MTWAKKSSFFFLLSFLFFSVKIELTVCYQKHHQWQISGLLFWILVFSLYPEILHYNLNFQLQWCHLSELPKSNISSRGIFTMSSTVVLRCCTRCCTKPLPFNYFHRPLLWHSHSHSPSGGLGAFFLSLVTCLEHKIHPNSWHNVLQSRAFSYKKTCPLKVTYSLSLHSNNKEHKS